jgi:hypothetical protein
MHRAGYLRIEHEHPQVAQIVAIEKRRVLVIGSRLIENDLAERYAGIVVAKAEHQRRTERLELLAQDRLEVGVTLVTATIAQISAEDEAGGRELHLAHALGHRAQIARGVRVVCKRSGRSNVQVAQMNKGDGCVQRSALLSNCQQIT